MKKFIPKTNEELIEQMKMDNFKGSYYIQNDYIIWNISDKVFLEIILYNQLEEAYISYYCNIDNKIRNITHEHPMMEELYKLLKKLNKETNTLVIKKTLFGKNARIYWYWQKNFDEAKFNNKKYEIYKF